MSYDALCIATGARPKLIVDHPLVVGIRDTESVDSLCHRLKDDARKVLVIGEYMHNSTESLALSFLNMSSLISPLFLCTSSLLPCSLTFSSLTLAFLTLTSLIPYLILPESISSNE